MKIALTYTGSDVKHVNYINWLKEENGVEIHSFYPGQNSPEEIEKCDALVLSGGVDIHPSCYKNQNLDYPNVPDSFNLKRDELEISLFNKSLQSDLPVLGICRGMQLINVALGGSMKQDLGELNSIHKAEGSDKVHDIIIKEDSLLYDIVNEKELPANSAHHQSPEKIASDLYVNCYSIEGIPEGLEWKKSSGKPFMLGIQWHPERMYKIGLEDSPLSKLIRKRFIKEVENSLNRK